MLLRTLIMLAAVTHSAHLYAQVTPVVLPYSAYSFPGAKGWEETGDKNRLSLISPSGDGILFELVLKDQPQSETLEEANKRVNFFNQRVPEKRRGTPKKVSGQGWRGLIQSQITHSGGHEFQLVVKTSDKTLVFYLASPPGVPKEKLQQLEGVLLSLSVPSKASVELIDVPPSKKNCSLVSPPSGTKSKGSQSGILFGFPETIPNDFTGCHHVWLADDKQGQDWNLKMTTYFSNGEPSIYAERLKETGSRAGAIILACRYEGEKLVSEQQFEDEPGQSISKCPSVQTLRQIIQH